MAADLTFTSWSRPEAGHRWMVAEPVNGSGESHRYLVPGVGMAHRYGPASETGLFRHFAEIEPTEASVLGFADAYGSLGGTVAEPIAIPSGERSIVGAGERLRSWVSEIDAMRRMVNLWDLARSRDARLGDYVLWQEPGVRWVDADQRGRLQSSEWIATDKLYPDLLDRFPRGDVVGPALHLVQRQVNRKLVEHGVSARLLWDARYTRLGLHIVPLSLIGFLWFQFAQAIDGDKDYRRCPDCRKWFESTPHATRSDRVFCSPSCKASAHRKKIAEARRLYAGGVGIKEIARQLDSTPAKVQGWVNPSGRQSK
ncbi:MAG: hypothetical protein IPM24_00020 [Bryobacterales bacterium]|nr:hypothetical protein [Bryobacterales bacterium]